MLDFDQIQLKCTAVEKYNKISPSGRELDFSLVTFHCTVKGGGGAVPIFGRAVSDRQDDTLSSGQRLQPDHLGLWTMAPPPVPCVCLVY